MERIGHEASSKELAAAIEQYNDAVGRHQQAAQAASEPLELSDDELAEINIEGLETQRQGLLSERLANRQDAVRLARQRVELVERMQGELDERASEAEKEFNSVLKRTRRALEKATGGAASTQAGRLGNEKYATRQFEFQVRQAVPCREAEAALKRARHVRDTNRANIQRAKETVITSVVALRQFIGSEIGGEVIRDERANIDQQTPGQRVSAR